MLQACQLLDEFNQCVSWQAISMPEVDPSMWSSSYSFGFGLVFFFWLIGLGIGYVVRLVKMGGDR